MMTRRRRKRNIISLIPLLDMLLSDDDPIRVEEKVVKYPEPPTDKISDRIFDMLTMFPIAAALYIAGLEMSGMLYTGTIGTVRRTVMYGRPITGAVPVKAVDHLEIKRVTGLFLTGYAADYGSPRVTMFSLSLTQVPPADYGSPRISMKSS